MARPRNEASRELISDAAFACFIELGYDATTYDQISKRSGISRPLVQHYFPHKNQLAVAPLGRLLKQSVSLADDYVPTIFHDTEAQAARLFVVGQIFFGYLTTTGKPFFVDLLKNRALTNELIDLASLYPTTVDSADSTPSDEIVMALGGFYELAFQRLSKSESFDATDAFSAMVSSVLQSTGSSRARTVRVISESTLSPATLDELVESLSI